MVQFIKIGHDRVIISGIKIAHILVVFFGGTCLGLFRARFRHWMKVMTTHAYKNAIARLKLYLGWKKYFTVVYF